MEFSALLQFIFAGITLGSIYGIVGIGFSLIFNATGAINFAQGEFVVLGAFLTISFYSLGLPVLVSVVISFFVMTAIAAAIELTVFRGVKYNVMAIIIGTIGMSLVLRTIALLGWGREPLGLPHFFGEHTVRIAGATITYQAVFIIITAIAILVFLEFILNRTITGKALRAVVEDREAARTSGIMPEKFTLFAVALAGGLGALSGSVVAPLAFLSYGSGGLLGLKGFAAAIIGGLRKPSSSLYGGITLGIIEALAAAFLPSGYKDAVALLVLLLVLAIKPEGIFAPKELRKA